eukprot:252724-Pyramimonas_sp.AAC.1
MCIHWLLAGEGSLKNAHLWSTTGWRSVQPPHWMSATPQWLAGPATTGRLSSATLDISSPALCSVDPPHGSCR